MHEPSTLNIFQAVRQGDIETVRYLVSTDWHTKYGRSLNDFQAFRAVARPAKRQRVLPVACLERTPLLACLYIV